jgi:hypothetical protein
MQAINEGCVFSTTVGTVMPTKHNLAANTVATKVSCCGHNQAMWQCSDLVHYGWQEITINMKQK